MENNSPLHDSGPRINLASVRKNKQRSRMSTASPMATDRIYNMDFLHVDPARLQLISPPPEETLRRISRSGPFTPSLGDSNSTSNPKRKRSQQVVASPASNQPPLSPTSAEQQQPIEATPNPKPRKQLKQHARTQSIDSPTRPSRTTTPTATTPVTAKRVLFQSPHVANPDADFIPPVPSSTALSTGPSHRLTLSARSPRSVTPIPPYEPPKDVFTPPREVFMTPTISKSSKRKTATTSRSAKGSSAKGKGLKVHTKALRPNPVKLEMPDIDLSAPMPPPSPTDDPLLLSGPPEPISTPIRPKRVEIAISTQEDDLPPSSPPPEDDIAEAETFDWHRHTEPEGSTDFSMIDVDPANADVTPLPLFDLNDLPISLNGGWSDSDDDEDDLVEGEGEYTGRWQMMKVRTKADPPSSATRGRMEEWGRPISPFPRKVERLSLVGEDQQGEREGQEESMEEEKEEIEEEEEVRRMSVEPEDRVESEEEEEVRRISIEPHEGSDSRTQEDESPKLVASSSVMHTMSDSSLQVDTVLDSPRRAVDAGDDIASEEVDEEREVREMSVEHEEDDTSSTSVNHSQAPFGAPPAPVHSVQQVSPSATGSPVSALLSPRSSQHPIASNHFAFPGKAGPSYPVAHVPFPAFNDASTSHDHVQHRVETPEPHPYSYRSQNSSGIYNNVFVDEDTYMRNANAVEANASNDEEDDGSSDGEEVGVVKITSADPRAAARAAAILKQHDYDCFTKIVMKRRHAEAKRRRDSHSAVDDLVKGSRRRSLSSAGVGKEEHEMKRRRSTLGMGVIGEQVFIPGSPVITLPELLKEAEAEVVSASPGVAKTPGLWARRSAEGSRDPFKTPLPERYRVQRITSGLGKQVENAEQEDITVKEWTKEDWKQLDACFTDERLEVGQRLGLTDADGLASIDLVHVEDVVKRFVQMQGGDQTIAKCGENWTKDNLLQRVRALQNKQRSGIVAPPTTPYTPQTVNAALGGNRRVPSMDVPDFTPLGRRALPPRKPRPMLPPPVVHGAPFEQERPKKLHASLLAPRYSHLLEEAIAISQEVPHAADTSSSSNGEESHVSVEIESDAPITPSRQFDKVFSNPTAESQATTIGKRVKGFLFSYLPTLSKTTPSKAELPRRPGLPLPPPDVLEKPRGPIVTPVRPLAPKAKHPKELVHLHPAPQPPKISMIPRAVKPRRLVELHPAPPPTSEPVPIPRPRRSSGGSVKDLVQSFEELQGRSASEKEVRKMGLNRVRSLGELKRREDSRPTWKP